MYVTTFLKLPFALLAALALLLLWSGPATAGEPAGDSTPVELTSPVDPAPVDPAPNDPAPNDPPPADQAPPADDAGPAADLPPVADTAAPDDAGLSSIDAPASSLDVPGAPADGSGLSSEDSTDLTAACTELLTDVAASGLPADLDCGGLADCVALLLPEGVTPEALEGLSEEDLDALLGSTDVDGFLACVEALVPVPVTTAPVPVTSPAPVLQPAASATYYANCDDARARGAAPVYADDPGYRAGLDRDSDGIGCESDEATVRPVSGAGTPVSASGQLAYTGVELTPMLAAGAVLLAGGSGLLLAARRRSS